MESEPFLLSGRPGSLEPSLMTTQEEGAIWNDSDLPGFLHKKLWVSNKCHPEADGGYALRVSPPNSALSRLNFLV